jgi:ribosomal protein S4
MHKFYKHKLYRKYHDEIWGQIASSKKFSYNKKLILTKFRDVIVRRRLRVKTKFKYFKKGFLKHLKNTSFIFRKSRKILRAVLFTEKKKFRIAHQSRSKSFRSNKILISLKLGLILLSNLTAQVLTGIKSTNLIFLKKKNYPFLLGSNLRTQIFYKMKWFLRANNFQFTLKKKLNLRRQKVFFYSVHIAAPKKKNKKISLFGLKNIYYKKISLFFGFKKTAQFFKSCAYPKVMLGKNSFGVFLSLEGQLSNFIFRLNLFPSVYFVKKFIQFGNVFVNNKTVNYSSYIVNFNEIISFNRRYWKYFYFHIKSKLRNKKVYLNYPSFMEVDYKLFVAMLIRNPILSDLTKPVSFDLYTKFLTISK